MQTNFILTQIPFDQLVEAIGTHVVKSMSSLRPPVDTTTNNGIDSSNEDEYLTRKQVAKILKVSLVTLHKYTTEGLIAAYRIKRQVRYKPHEVQQALQRIQTV